MSSARRTLPPLPSRMPAEPCSAPEPQAPAPESTSPPAPAAADAEIQQARSAGESADFTDADLHAAFASLLDQISPQTGFPTQLPSDSSLEPLLRATVRRALAEHSPTVRPFHAPGALDRCLWHLRALVSSRSYEEILFEKTRRFQILETFLLDASSLALVSYASSDPARHAVPKRVANTVTRLATRVRREDGTMREQFELPESRNAVALAGKFVVMLAIVRGRPNEMVLADLAFALRRIEDRFHGQFLHPGSPLLHPLQPYLEDCLLIQSPGGAA